MGINMSYANINTNPNIYAVCNFQLDIRDLKQLNTVIAELKKLKSVLSVERVRGSFRDAGKRRPRKKDDIDMWR